MIIGFTGSKGVGKTTVAQMIHDRLGAGQRVKSIKNMSFANRLKETTCALFGISMYYLNDHKDDPSVKNYKLNYRQTLQQLGTDFVRDKISETFWLDIVIDEITEDVNVDCLFPDDHTVDDIRFNNEADALRKLNAIIIHIQRPGYTSDGHSSEHGVTVKKGDYVIINSGTKEDLYNKVMSLTFNKTK